MYRIKIDNNILKEELKISLKYDISSIYLPHSLEIFSTESQIIDMVSNFHLPCVRLYYNGIKLNLLPSCITAISTGMCLDYKYISSTKSPMTIISNKKLKGFGTWININEKKQMYNFVIGDSFWKMLFNSMRYKNIYNYLYQPISNFSKIIKSRFYTMSANANIKYSKNDRYCGIGEMVSDMTYLATHNMSEIISKTFGSVKIIGINYDLFTCIDYNGDVLPVKKWIIETTWNIYIDFDNT